MALNVILGIPFIHVIIRVFFGVLSGIGALFMAYFSVLLIIDSIKLIRKKS